MHRVRTILFTALLTITFVLPAIGQHQPDPDSPRYKGVMALDEFFASEGEQAITEFIENKVAASVRDSMGEAKLVETLSAMRSELAGAQVRGAMPQGPLSAEVMLEGPDGAEVGVEFALDEQDTARFVLIRSPGHTVSTS